MADIIGGTNPASFGSFACGRRKDTAVDLAGTNGYAAEIQFDSAGNLRVSEEGGKARYFATSSFACDSTATDIATFPGSASKTAKLQKITVTTTATAAATGALTVLRRSAVNTAGTTGNASVGKADTGNGTAAIQPVHYTAHPTGLGTSAGTIAGEQVVQQAAGTVPATKVVFDFRAFNGNQGLTVRGATDIIALNAAAALGGSGNAWLVVWEWNEEATSA